MQRRSGAARARGRHRNGIGTRFLFSGEKGTQFARPTFAIVGRFSRSVAVGRPLSGPATPRPPREVTKSAASV